MLAVKGIFSPCRLLSSSWLKIEIGPLPLGGPHLTFIQYLTTNRSARPRYGVLRSFTAHRVLAIISSVRPTS